MINAKPSSRWRRLVTFRLRSLLLFATAIAVALAAWRQWVEKPYERQQAALAALNQFADRVEFQDPGPRWLPEWVARHLRRAVSLHVERLAVRDEHLVHVGQLPHLERLYLARTRVTDEGVRHLARLTELRRLSLWGTTLTDEGVQHLAGLHQLEALDIQGTRCTPACLSHLAPAKRMKMLRLGFELDDRGIADLARLAERSDSCPQCRKVTLAGLGELRKLRGITTLSLRDTTLHAEEARALLDIAGLTGLDARDGRMNGPAVVILRSCPSLQRLYLFEMGIPVADVLREYAPIAWYMTARSGMVELGIPGDRLQVVVRSKNAPFDLSQLSGAAELRSLNFNEAEYHGGRVDFRRLTKLQELVWIPPLEEPQLRQLGELSNLKNLALRVGPLLSPAAFEPLGALRDLQQLSLHRCHLTDEHLAFLGHLTSLRQLSLGENPLKGDCLAHLRHAPQLKQLSLLECKSLDESKLKHLAAIKSLTNITLQYTPVSDLGLKALHGMPNLKVMSLLGSRVTAQGKATLKATLPPGADVY